MLLSFCCDCAWWRCYERLYSMPLDSPVVAPRTHAAFLLDDDLVFRGFPGGCTCVFFRIDLGSGAPIEPLPPTVAGIVALLTILVSFSGLGGFLGCCFSGMRPEYAATTPILVEQAALGLNSTQPFKMVSELFSLPHSVSHARERNSGRCAGR